MLEKEFIDPLHPTATTFDLIFGTGLWYIYTLYILLHTFNSVLELKSIFDYDLCGQFNSDDKLYDEWERNKGNKHIHQTYINEHTFCHIFFTFYLFQSNSYESFTSLFGTRISFFNFIPLLFCFFVCLLVVTLKIHKLFFYLFVCVLCLITKF